MHETRHLRRGDGSRQLTVRDGDGEATSPVIGLNRAVPSQSQFTVVRRAAGEVEHGGREVKVVAGHHHACLIDALLNDAVFVFEAGDVNRHGALKDPRLTEVVVLGAVEVFYEDIDFAGDEPRRGQAPLDLCRDVQRELSIAGVDLTTDGQDLKPFIERGAGVVHQRVLDAQVVVVAQFQTHFQEVAQPVGVLDDHRPPHLLRGLKAHGVVVEEVLGGFKQHQLAFAWCTRLPTSVAGFGTGRWKSKSGNVGSFKQHASPLMIIVHRVVDRDVDQPCVFAGVDGEGDGRVFLPLSDAVQGLSVGSVVDAFKPCVSGQGFVGKPSNIVERERGRLLGVFVDVGAKGGRYRLKNGAV